MAGKSSPNAEPLLKEVENRIENHPIGPPETVAPQVESEKSRALTESQGRVGEPYNPASILSRLGLSWWADVIPLCTPSGELKGENLRKLRKIVARATPRMPSLNELEGLKSLEVVQDDMDLEECENYVKAQHKELLAVLDQAIRLNSAINCSPEPMQD